MSSITLINRKKSYIETKPEFKTQDLKIMGCLGFNTGLNAWDISKKTGIFITDVRRSLNGLVKLGRIKPSGSVLHSDTNRANTTYIKVRVSMPGSISFIRDQQLSLEGLYE